MRWVLITAFGVPVEPEVNRNLTMVSGPTWACAGSTAPDGRGRQQRLQECGGAACKWVAGDDDLDLARHDRLDGAAVGLAVGGEDEPRGEQLDDRPQLAEILRDERVGRRDRRIGDADIHGGEADERMLDVVARQDHDRPLRRKVAPQQRRADAADLLQGLGIGELAPAAAGIPLRQEDPFGRGRGPVVEPLGQLRRVGRERVGRFEVDGAVRPALHDHVARAEAHRPHRRRRGSFGTTLFDRGRHGGLLGVRSCCAQVYCARAFCARLSARAFRETP